MKVLVKDYLNLRTGGPHLGLDNNPTYYEPGDEVEITQLVFGEAINGNKLWAKLENEAFASCVGLNYPYPTWISDFGVLEAWNKSLGEGVTVIVLDTGFAEGYCRLSNPISKLTVLGDDGMDKIGHGTLMASIIASVDTNLLGVAPLCNMISVKYFDSMDRNRWNRFRDALLLVKSQMHSDVFYVINCSSSGVHSGSEVAEISSIINDITSNFKAVFVSAVGNEGNHRNPDVVPARLPNVISVAAIQKQLDIYTRIVSSNYWPEISVAAPGSFDLINKMPIFSSLRYSGSSLACAFVSGLIALFLSKVRPTGPLYPVVSRFLQSITNVENIYLSSLLSDVYYSMLNGEKTREFFKKC